jgi:hypothetical protein
MSHHLDTPLARQNGQLYIDDLYVFPGTRSTVFVMDVNSTVTEPNVKRGFHPEARSIRQVASVATSCSDPGGG